MTYLANAERMLKFIDKIDNYLIADIRTMLSIEDRQYGGLGFSCVQNILSGMELMGRFLTQGDGDIYHVGNLSFKCYWEQLAKDTPLYNSNALSEIFRDIIRNGTAHYFMVKHGIQVHLHHGVHLAFSNSGNLHINCNDLFDDFYKTYSRITSEIRNFPEKYLANFQCLLNDAVNTKNAKKIEAYRSEIINNAPERIYTSYSGTSASIPVSYDNEDLQVMTTGASTLLADYLVPSGDTFITAIELPPKDIKDTSRKLKHK